MAEPLVICDKLSGSVRQLRLNRPDKRNALNIPLLEAFIAHFSALNADDAVRVIVLRGEGQAFCAGLDLHEARVPARSETSAQLIAEMVRVVYHSPKVTVAAVRGAAFAGGAGLMSACDIVVSTEDARIAYPEVRVGMVAGLVMELLRRQVSDRHARELLLLGEAISGKRAEAIGLVNRAVPEAEWEEAIAAVVACALKGAPGAIARTKEMLAAVSPPTLEAHLQHALRQHVEIRNSAEALEGFEAFAARRPPTWQD